MKAVRAYTCDSTAGRNTMVIVSDDGKHYPFDDITIDELEFFKGTDLSEYGAWPEEYADKCTNIQPVELPDKEEV